MKEFFSLLLSAEVRRKILWDNCARLYNIQQPAAARKLSEKEAAVAR
jgi:hypothetical protein